MKWRNLFAMAMLAIILAPAVLSAAPYIQSVATPPRELYGVEELWNVTLNNPDSITYEVWLEGTIAEDARGQVFWAKTREFSLPPGIKVVKYADIVQIGIERQTHAQGYEQFAVRTGGLPAGDYTFTVKLMPEFGSKSVGFDVKPMGPPRLILPRQGDTIRVPNPQFVWTPPSPMSKDPVTYELRLYEVLPGQTGEQALRANPPWFTKSGIEATSLAYPTSAKALPDTGNFAWQVTAQTGAGVAAVSEVWTFHTAGALQPPPPPPSVVTPDATVVWQHQGASGWEIWFADFTATPSPAIIGSPQILCPDPGNNMDPAVSYDRDGNTWVVWSHSAPGPNPHYEIRWSRRSAGTNSWSPPVALAPTPAPLHQVDPAIAFDSDGKGFCVWGQGYLWTDYGGGDALFLHGSFWDGGVWSAENKLPGAGDTCRLPEIAFTTASASAPTPQTTHAAVVIATTHCTGPGSVFRWMWDGSAWTDAARLPTTGGVVSNTYKTYLDAVSPTPAQDRITLAPLQVKLEGKDVVVAAWTRETPTAQTKLMTCNGYCSSGAWTWTEWPAHLNGPSGTGYHDPAVVVDDNQSSCYIFIGPGQVYEKHWGFCGLLTPPTDGSDGSRPTAAWVGGATRGVVAAWYDANDITWSFYNRVGSSWVWTQPAALVASGADLNPDIAATSGSHTMPAKP